jgi:predicted RecA/RadA family phage recombinase
MTAGEIQFCDGAFDALTSATIPPYGWQTFNVTVPYGETPKFYVKAAAAGDVEINFGSDGMGFASNVYDLAGMIPHTLTLTQGEDTTLTVELTRLHGQTLDLANAVPMTSGATVFNGDVISITPTATAGHYAKLTINGVNYGRLESEDMTLVIAGETTIETEAVALDDKTVTLDVGANTTLMAAQTRLAGMLVDLTTPANVASGGTVYVGDTVEFTAATTESTGHHVTLTVNDDPVEVDESGKASVIVDADIVAVSASVADEEE